MADTSTVKTLGWGNQVRVVLYPDGRLAPPDEAPPEGALAQLQSGGDGLYRLARIVNDQVKNPFREGRVSQSGILACLAWTQDLLDLTASPPDGFLTLQLQQLRASAGVVLLSAAESQEGRRSETATAIRNEAMGAFFNLLTHEDDQVLAERLLFALDWVMPALPGDLATRARAEMNARLPLSPPYEEWFAGGEGRLVVDWKAGGEFVGGWVRRLKEEGFALVTDGGTWASSVLTKTYDVGGVRTEVHLTLAPDRGDVFSRMDDERVHVVGYDGHSDWGRAIPRSLSGAPPAKGTKAVFYLLCCGKQILQKVRGVYPTAHVVTTFNAARFTHDFSYSQDFSAFMHCLEGFARRESWELIRGRVNKDWYNNPEKNYIFPTEILAVARSLDQDHDGQSDVFDLLVDYNTFEVAKDTANEFRPIKPERKPETLVGTALHLAVQVFHTLAHFNEILEPFTTELRVSAGGWYDPSKRAGPKVRTVGPTRVEVRSQNERNVYLFAGSCHHAHASEEAWRALATFSLGVVVMDTEPAWKGGPTWQKVVNALLMVCHGLEIDDAPGRDRAVWSGLLSVMGLPTWLALDVFQAAKQGEHHHYTGARRHIKALGERFGKEALAELDAWWTAQKS